MCESNWTSVSALSLPFADSDTSAYCMHKIRVIIMKSCDSITLFSLSPSSVRLTYAQSILTLSLLAPQSRLLHHPIHQQQYLLSMIPINSCDSYRKPQSALHQEQTTWAPSTLLPHSTRACALGSLGITTVKISLLVTRRVRTEWRLAARVEGNSGQSISHSKINTQNPSQQYFGSHKS